MTTTTWVGRPTRATTTTRRGVVASVREFSRRRLACSGRTLGYVFILLVCVIWVAASFLVSDLEARGGIARDDELFEFVDFHRVGAGARRDHCAGVEKRILWSERRAVGDG
jgi:hypothetical protein